MAQYYDLHKHCQPNVVDLLEAASAHGVILRLAQTLSTECGGLA